jgi:hypothetical protein
VNTNVYAKISAVSADLAKDGIAKSRKNAQQGYSFRGIDEVLDALGPLLPKHGLVILPRILKRECTERESRSGGTLFSVTVEAEFDFVSGEDGSTHTVRTFGEAMDSADKATNKAMSAAYKYAAFLAFCIPTEGDNDADATTHQPAALKTSAPPPPSPKDDPAFVLHKAVISEAQVKRLFAISKNAGWRRDEILGLVKRETGVERPELIPLIKYNGLIKILQEGPK